MLFFSAVFCSWAVLYLQYPTLLCHPSVNQFWFDWLGASLRHPARLDQRLPRKEEDIAQCGAPLDDSSKGCFFQLLLVVSCSCPCHSYFHVPENIGILSWLVLHLPVLFSLTTLWVLWVVWLSSPMHPTRPHTANKLWSWLCLCPVDAVDIGSKLPAFILQLSCPHSVLGVTSSRTSFRTCACFQSSVFCACFLRWHLSMTTWALCKK